MGNEKEHPIHVDWQAQARARLETAWTAGDALKLWDILRNPNNTTSRQHMKTLCVAVPAPKAAIKVWWAFLTTHFPALEAQLAERKAVNAARIQARQDAWHRETLHGVATLGPHWSHNGTVYPHALAFVEALMSAGYTPEATGIGTVCFRREGGWQVGPMRNKHINAALTYLALPAPTEGVTR